MFIKVGFSDLQIILRNIGHLLEISSLLFLVPLIVAIIFREFTVVYTEFLLGTMICYVLGLTLRRVFYTEEEADFKHAFLIVAFFWLIFAGIAALPIWFNGANYLDAYFESMSCLTTTGLTVIKPLLNSLPASVIFWRSLLNWVGGIGIIIMALMGLLSSYTKIGKLMAVEHGREFLEPNLKNSVTMIWQIYVFLTIVGIIMLYLSGMPLFHAVNYSMSGISTGGSETTSEGLTAVNNGWQPVGLHNYWVDISLTIIICFGAINFGTHYLVLKKRDWRMLLRDSEFKVLMLLAVGSSLLLIPKLGIHSSFFHAFSAVCGGFSIASESIIRQWNDFVKLLLIALMFIGGSSTAASGGIKISRFIILVKSIFWKIKKVVLPERTFFAKKFDGKPLEEKEISEVIYFIMFYIMFIVAGVFVLTFLGYNLQDSLFEVVSAQSNVGIGTGITAPGMNVIAELMIIFNMWVGRLELIPFFAIIGFAMNFRARKQE